jgi:hypothetical protein
MENNFTPEKREIIIFETAMKRSTNRIILALGVRFIFGLYCAVH